ncbi:MAG: GGDEF domain-containing protein [Candidatus Saccharibacteria bacterium]|nr:GGDEF domain-containing protein [Moraxellaceae bacterium]
MKHDIICRWSGEEFVVCLNKCNLADAERIAEQIRVTVANSVSTYELNHLSVTISVGLASYRHTETLAELLARADSALYRAKDQGRNTVVAPTEWLIESLQ